MISQQRLAALLVFMGVGASAYGQARTDFDTLPEGFVGPTLVTPAGTFLDLQLDTLGTPGSFAIEDASVALALQSRFSTPNVLGLGSFAAGGLAQTTPVKSFRVMLAHPANAISLGLYLDAGSPLNSVLVEFYSGGVLGTATSTSAGVAAYTELKVFQCDNPGPYDEIRVRGQGLLDDGRFRAMLDTLVIANAPCGSAPKVCAAGLLTACPCGNTPIGTVASGCLNSTGQGGLLDAGGIASLTVDEVEVVGGWLPPLTSALLVASNSLTTGAVFGDGYSCVGQGPQRIVIGFAGGAGNWSYPATGPRLSAAAGMTAGTPRSFQLFYRDNAPFCTSAVFNVTNGFTITYAP